jgi:hypothetical protein
MGKFIVNAATPGVDTGTTGVLDTDADTMIVDVRDLSNLSIYLNQIVDNGNCSLLVEKTVDGTNYATVATKVQSDFPVGANKSIEIAFSDSNGMPLLCQAVKVTLSGHTGTGTYTVTAAGQQRSDYR